MHVSLVAIVGIMVLTAGCVGSDSGAEPQSVPSEGAASTGPAAESTAGGSDVAQPEAPTEVENTGSKSLHFEQTFSLMVTHAKAQAHRVNQEPNCVGFGKDQVWLILGGRAEATWSNPGPFATQMTLDVRDIGLMATNNGSASPSIVEFGRFQTVPNALLGLWFIVQPTADGVVLQQPVSLTISFDYLGVPDVSTTVEPCVYTATFEEDAAATEVRA